MDDKVLGVCPHAVKMEPGQMIYGCGARPVKLNTGNGYTTYCPPCIKANAEGNYKRCPWFPP